jgi:hypothetical protein
MMLAIAVFSSSGVGATAAEEGDDRVFGTDADRHDDISHNVNSEFGGNADGSEMAGLAVILINSQIPPPPSVVKKKTRATN